MTAKSSYKSKLRSDRKRKQSLNRRAASQIKVAWDETSFEQWVSMIVRAVAADDVSALRLLAREKRWSTLDIHVSVAGDDAAKSAEREPLVKLAVLAGAVQCAGEIAEMAARADRLAIINCAMRELCIRFETPGADATLWKRMISAVVIGAAQGMEAIHSGFHLWLDAERAEAMRFSMAVLENRPCKAVGASKFQCGHVEIKRKIIGAIARSDVKALEESLDVMASGLRGNPDEVDWADDAQMFMEAAICCKRFDLLALLYMKLLELFPGSEEAAALLSRLLSSAETLACSGAVIDEAGLKRCVRKCVAFQIASGCEVEMGRTFIVKIAPQLNALRSPFEDGVAEGVALIEEHLLRASLETDAVIERATSALRI